MNQGRIWCVVHPTVGLPLLLGSVAATSLIVHASLMTQTTWMSGYWAGSKLRHAAAAPQASLVPGANPAFSMTIVPVPAQGTAAPASFVITVTPSGAKATASEAAVTTASAHAPPIHTASLN